MKPGVRPAILDVIFEISLPDYEFPSPSVRRHSPGADSSVITTALDGGA